MKLYSLVNMACAKGPEHFSFEGDYPSWMQIGENPYQRIFLVSRDLETATKAANQFNCLAIENSNLVVQKLSRKGMLKFYAGKFLCYFMGEPNDLDSRNKRLEMLLGLD